MSDQQQAHRGTQFLKEFKRLSESQAFEIGNLVFHEFRATVSDMPKVLKAGSPGKAVFVATTVTVQKAMYAAGLGSTEETRACLEAVGSLAGDLGSAALLGPETLGLGAILPLALAAIDAYDVGKSCFVQDGRVTHSVVGSVKRPLKTALKPLSKHGPI